MVWHACEHPERPPEPGRTAYHRNCRGCLLALRVAAQLEPDHVMGGWEWEGWPIQAAVAYLEDQLSPTQRSWTDRYNQRQSL